MTGVAKPRESAIQGAIIAYCRALGIVAVHVPNGAVLAGDATARAKQTNALKRAGMAKGFPDLLLLRGGDVAFVEVKREGERLRPEQEHWRDWLSAAGHRWSLWRSVDDAGKTLREWGWL